MKNIISARLAGNILLAALGALSVFHVLALLGVVPADSVMGGQAANSPASLMTLETIALVVTVGFALIVAVKLGYLNAGKFSRVIGYGVWLIFAYLILNTLGNLMSTGSFEKFVFAPVTVLLALCALRLAMEKAAA